jgi:hypothetical protein
MTQPIEATPTQSDHPSLRKLCETRQEELKAALASMGEDAQPQTRQDIQSALDALDALLTGNLDQIPPVVASQLTKWIDSSKYLGSRELRDAQGAKELS